MNEQVINTGDAATDQAIIQEIRQGLESAGMRVEVVPAPGGGLAIRSGLPAAVQAVAAAALPISGDALKPGAFEPAGPEGFELKQQVMQGDFSGLRNLLADSHAMKQWDHRYFMVNEVIGSALHGALDAALQQEPAAADLKLLYGGWQIHQAWQARGHGTADETSDEQWSAARDHVSQAQTHLRAAAAAFPSDPTPLAFLMNGLLIFGDLDRELAAAFKEATARAPDFSEPYWFMVNQTSQKWGGSHAKSLQVAREAASKGRAGTDVYACLFRAHLLVWQYAMHFQQDESAAMAYLSRPDVRDELARAFDAWVREPSALKRHSIPKLHWAAFWFFRTGDRARLKKALKATQNVICETPWAWDPSGTLGYTQAMQQAMTDHSA